ncbi:recombinase family protein [Actinoallomurus sp. NBC_01490]|uniref:recombinase family protein n=1 Tax=Actinoallomurus sp. NBC_01490 TaxID=2903557 RepID=UPI002E32A123|nr:recombinase family protein [Actinoallomurus sp. NBC_01490]
MMRFAFLGRVSTEDLQDPAASRQWQLSRAELLVADHGRIVAEFFDVGQSRAVSWLRRPESARLLAALEDPDRGFEAVVIGEPQRVFYDNQFGLVFPLFEHFDVGLWVPEVGGPIDPDSEAHSLIMSVYAGMSKAERRRIQVRVRSAMIAQVEREGRFLGGRPPYGYRLADAGPHRNPALAALGARRHRLEPDPAAASVVERIFAMRIAGYGARRIAGALDTDGIPCPSAHDPARNRHRSAAGWTTGTVLSILGNPRYTGHEVWNKQSKTDVLIDPHNVGLGTRTSMRWNPRAEWVSSPKMAHPAIVNTEEFEQAQHTHAIRGPRRTYLLRGLLHCALCGRRMEGAWNNGRANYRCHHRAADSELPGSVFVREDRLLPHLAALLIRIKIESRRCVTLQNIQIPEDTDQQVAMCRRLGLALRYDHLAQTLTVQGRQGDIIIRLM